jgi:hypothetical protein
MPFDKIKNNFQIAHKFGMHSGMARINDKTLNTQKPGGHTPSYKRISSRIWNTLLPALHAQPYTFREYQPHHG